MTGKEHYLEAERCLERAEQSSKDAVDRLVATAHVHATLALFDYVREIGDQLDARGLHNRMAHL